MAKPITDRERLKSRISSAKVVTYEDPPVSRVVRGEHKSIGSKDILSIIQNPLGVAGGVVSNAVQKVTSGEILEGTALEGLSLSSGLLSYTKFWRLKLLMNVNAMEKTEYSPRPTIGSLVTGLLPSKLTDKEDPENKHTTLTMSRAEINAKDFVKISARRDQRDNFIPKGKNYIEERFKALEGIPKARQNNIFIINTSVSPYIAIQLQNRPDELRVEPKSTWASVVSMGRNNPFMMYTGGEDSISFDISWYANDKNHRDEVIYKCRLLESWTKADGYNSAPPVLRINWGTSGLFDDALFILESAPYTLTHFQDRSVRSIDSMNTGSDYYRRGIRDLHLYPNCATQTLTFKRVTQTNLTHNEIVPLEKLTGINGIDTNFASI